MSETKQVSKERVESPDDEGWESNSSLESSSDEVDVKTPTVVPVTSVIKAGQPIKTTENVSKLHEKAAEKESLMVQNVEVLEEKPSVHVDTNVSSVVEAKKNLDKEEVEEESVVKIKKKLKSNSQEDKKCVVKKIKKKSNDINGDGGILTSPSSETISNHVQEAQTTPIQSIVDDVKTIGIPKDDVRPEVETKEIIATPEQQVPADGGDGCSKEVVVKKVIKIKKKNLKPKIDVVETPPQANDDGEAVQVIRAESVADNDAKFLVECLKSEVVKNETESCIDVCGKSGSTDTLSADAWEGKTDAITSATGGIDDIVSRLLSDETSPAKKEESSSSVFEKEKDFMGSISMIGDDFVYNSLFGQPTKENLLPSEKSRESFSRSLEAEQLNEYLPFTNNKLLQLNDTLNFKDDLVDRKDERIQNYDKITNSHVQRRTFQDDDYDDGDDVIENITKYLTGKLSQKHQPNSKVKNDSATESSSRLNENDDGDDDDDEDAYHRERNVSANKRMIYQNLEADDNKEEGLVDRIRRERNLKVAQHRGDKIYQPKRRGDTDEKVVEKTKHIRALVDKQVNVVDNLRISVQRFLELESLIKEIKMEGLDQRAEHENLEDLFTLMCKKYENELNVAVESLRVQKKIKATTRSEINDILRDWLNSESKQNSSKETREKLKNKESDVLDYVGKNPWEHIEPADLSVFLNKENNKNRPSVATTFSFEQNVKDVPEEKDMTSLSTDEFINRIRNKYALPDSKPDHKMASSAHPTNSQIVRRKFSVPEESVLKARKHLSSKVEITDPEKERYKYFHNPHAFEDIQTRRISRDSVKILPKNSNTFSSTHSYLKKH